MTRPYSAGERLLLVALLQGWNDVADLEARRSLEARGLVAARTVRRQRGSKIHRLEEPCLTGAGEHEARIIWDGLGRDERNELRAIALKAGLSPPSTPQDPRGNDHDRRNQPPA
jgi:hypothetical protein